MKIKSILAKPFAGYIYNSIKKDMVAAVADQDRILQELLKTGQKTLFGKDHRMGEVSDHAGFST